MLARHTYTQFHQKLNENNFITTQTMRKLLLTYMLLCFTLIGFCGIQKGPNGGPQKSKDQKTEAVKDSAQVEVKFPATQFQGTVEVSFKIAEDGTINVVNINANNPELIEYVIAKLEKIQLDPAYRDIGKTIKYRFQFKKEA